ncbi:hypothetical protein L6164_036752 [Bauhinia variegata]|uniref:Uncharacterized protein n=1 Tax=Bauhinia variegata TaxID=167791 RepID=A0ACB9KHX7_BAUVA|nr:hypothetical protein L6164_036752 [Bauhinia variegata]
MNSAKVGVLKETHQIGFRGFLESGDGGTLEAEIGLEVLSNLTNKALEGKLSDQKLGTLLVLSDLTESHCSWPETVRLLHTTGGRSRFPSSLGGQLLSWSFPSGGFASSLLGTSH